MRNQWWIETFLKSLWKQHLSMGFSCSFPDLEKWSLSDWPTWFSSSLQFLVGFCIYSLLMFFSVIAVCLHSRFDTYICKTLLIWLTCMTTFPPCGARPSLAIFFILFACQFHIFGINKSLLILVPHSFFYFRAFGFLG